MRLEKTDFIIGLDVVQSNSSLFIISEKGFGKRVNYSNFATKGRGGKGMTYLKITDKIGPAVGIRSVLPEDEIIISSKSGMTIRVVAKDVSVQGRTASGVKLLDIEDGDCVTEFAVITEEK